MTANDYLLVLLFQYSLLFGGFPSRDWEWNALEDEAEYMATMYARLMAEADAKS